MGKRLQHSRWKRLPGVYRFGDRQPPDPALEPQRVSLYLPASVLERADAMSLRAGYPDAQRYCERLLTVALEHEQVREAVEEVEQRHGSMAGLRAIADDPEYLAEWSASARSPSPPIPSPPPKAATSLALTDDRPADEDAGAAEVVLRHASLRGDDPEALLAALRRGDPIAPDAARDLLKALLDLEASTRDARALPRRLAYALHKLAFEGQVLLTDAHPGAAGDPATVDVLRLVQEGVDRILSGEDIRYYPVDGGAP